MHPHLARASDSSNHFVPAAQPADATVRGGDLLAYRVSERGCTESRERQRRGMSIARSSQSGLAAKDVRRSECCAAFFPVEGRTVLVWERGAGFSGGCCYLRWRGVRFGQASPWHWLGTKAVLSLGWPLFFWLALVLRGRVGRRGLGRVRRRRASRLGAIGGVPRGVCWGDAQDRAGGGGRR